MALELNHLTETNNEADRLYVTDKTGEYEAVGNPEGWGSPNNEQSQSALVVHVIRKTTSDDEVLVPVTTAAKHIPTALNSDEQEFELYYINDGRHWVYMWRIPVSADGTTDLEANALTDGDYYYNSVNTRVEKVQAGGNVEVTDYSELVDISQANVYQTLCKKFFSSAATIKRQKEYREYQQARTSGNCADDPLFMKAMETTMDIISAHYGFNSGLTTEAQAQMETLLDEKDIDNANSPA